MRQPTSETPASVHPKGQRCEINVSSEYGVFQVKWHLAANAVVLYTETDAWHTARIVPSKKRDATVSPCWHSLPPKHKLID